MGESAGVPRSALVRDGQQVDGRKSDNLEVLIDENIAAFAVSAPGELSELQVTERCEFLSPELIKVPVRDRVAAEDDLRHFLVGEIFPHHVTVDLLAHLVDALEDFLRRRILHSVEGLLSRQELESQAATLVNR